MLQLELPSQGADARQSVRRQPLDRQKQLVLLGLKAGLARSLFAEYQEAP